MCKYCDVKENLMGAMGTEIADTKYEACYISKYNGVYRIRVAGGYEDYSEPISYCPFCGRNLIVDADFDKYVSYILFAISTLPCLNVSFRKNDVDNCVDFSIQLPHNIHFSVSIFLDEPIGNTCVFTVHHNKELLVADSKPINEIVTSLKIALEKFNN